MPPIFGMLLNIKEEEEDDSDFLIEQSCRFNDDDSAALTWTPTVGNTDRQWIVSVWIKRGNIGLATDRGVWQAFDDSLNYMRMTITKDTDKLDIYHRDNGNVLGRYITTRVFQDTTNWYHILTSLDADNLKNGQRMRLWINGVEETDFDTKTNFSTSSTNLFESLPHYIGRIGSGNYFDGYMAEFHAINTFSIQTGDYAITDFGKFKNGVWVPKKFTGDHGPNGFYLPFADSSDLGADQSGNSNDFTSSGLVSADQVLDTPTNNYPTWNNLDTDPTFGGYTFANGNLEIDLGSSAGDTAATIWLDTSLGGKWYWEVTLKRDSGTPSANPTIALIRYSGDNNADYIQNSGNYYAGVRSDSGTTTYNIYDFDSGDTGDNVTIADGTVCCFALDLDNGKMWFGTISSGTITWEQGDPEAGTNARWSSLDYDDGYLIACRNRNNSYTNINFGQLDFAASSIPTGFKKINTSNLSESDIADPSTAFDIVIYTGDGNASKEKSNLSFQPDFVWIKNRDAADDNVLFDSVRGATKYLSSNTTTDETTDADTLLSFDTDGFTVGADVKVNTNNENYVAWCWKEQAQYGFDIVSYTGTGAAHAINHNLGGTPELMMVKNLDDGTDNWTVYHHKTDASAPEDKFLTLNAADAIGDATGNWNDTAPTSTQFTVGTNDKVNASDENFIAYLFRSISGFSKAFNYKGNGDADGPFVYLGFKPKYIMIKNTNTATSWNITDLKRSSYNPAVYSLQPDDSRDELTGKDINFSSNGFKIKTTDNSHNKSGDTYIGMAFAELPGKNSRAF